MQNVQEVPISSQESGLPPENHTEPLESFIADLRSLRDGMIAKDRKRRSAILIGQLAILAGEYRSGRRPRHRDLKRFFYFVAREQRAV